jgi:hypothetical protein
MWVYRTGSKERRSRLWVETPSGCQRWNSSLQNPYAGSLLGGTVTRMWQRAAVCVSWNEKLIVAQLVKNFLPLCNSKVWYCVHKNRTLARVLSRTNPAHTLNVLFPASHYEITSRSMPSSLKLCLPFRFSDQFFYVLVVCSMSAATNRHCEVASQTPVYKKLHNVTRNTGPSWEDWLFLFVLNSVSFSKWYKLKHWYVTEISECKYDTQLYCSL